MNFNLPSITGNRQSDENIWELYNAMDKALKNHWEKRKKEAEAKKKVKVEEPKDEQPKDEQPKDEQPKDEQPKDDAKLYVNSYQPYELFPSEQPPLIPNSPEDDDIRYNFEKQKAADLAATKAKLAAEAEAAKKRRNIPQGSKSDPNAPKAEWAEQEQSIPTQQTPSSSANLDAVRNAIRQSGIKDEALVERIAAKMANKSSSYIDKAIAQAQAYIKNGQPAYWVWSSFAR